MATPFSPNAFTPPNANDTSSLVRAILQLQQALGGTGTLPQNNLNILQNKVPPNDALSVFPRTGRGGLGGTGPTGATGSGIQGPTGPVGFSAPLPYTGMSGATFHFSATPTLGWPLCGFGLGANNPQNAWTYTPRVNGQLKVTVQGSYVAPTAQNMMARIMYGTGPAPGFGGTGGVPVPFAQNMVGTQAGVFQPLTLEGIVSNLVVGQLYWFDIALLSNNAGAATVGQLTPNSPIIWHVVEL